MKMNMHRVIDFSHFESGTQTSDILDMQRRAEGGIKRNECPGHPRQGGI